MILTALSGSMLSSTPILASGLTIQSIALSAYQGGFNIRCAEGQDGVIELFVEGGDPPYNYTWSSGQNTRIISGLTAGVYAVSVSDQAGCEVSATVSLVAPEPLGAEVACWPVGCLEERGFIQVLDVFGGLPPYRIQVDHYPDPGDGIFALSTPGNYEVRIEDANACVWTKEITLAVREVLLELGPDVDTILGSTIRLEAILAEENLQYQWSLRTGHGVWSCQNCPSPLLQTLSSVLEVALQVQDALGCRAVDDLLIRSQIEPLGYLPNSFSPNGDGQNDLFQFFPGPAILNVLWMRVYDRTGNQVFSTESWDPYAAPERAWDEYAQGQKVPTGTYVYALMVVLQDGQERMLSGSVQVLR